MLALEIYGGLVLVSFLVVAWLLIRYLLERLRVDSYPPEAAEAPTVVGVDGLRANEVPHIVGPDSVDEHFTTAPRELRIDRVEADRLVEQFDWPRYATWLKEPS